MVITKVIRLWKHHGAIDAVLLLIEQTPCINSLFACKCDRLDILRELYINIINGFNFSDTHGAMNHSGSLAKLT